MTDENAGALSLAQEAVHRIAGIWPDHPDNPDRLAQERLQHSRRLMPPVPPQ